MALCTTLLDGRIYPCSTGTYVHFFNKKFKTKFPEEKGLDIHKKGITKRQILTYINTPLDLCKYCVTSSIPTTRWRRSKLKKEEWLAK